MCRACRYLRQTICKKISANPRVQRANYSAKSQKQTSGKYFFQCKKTANSRFLFFVVEVLVLQKYKSKNNNDFLKNAFIMSFSVFINAFFVQFGCIKQNVHVAFASAVSLDIAHVVC